MGFDYTVCIQQQRTGQGENQKYAIPTAYACDEPTIPGNQAGTAGQRPVLFPSLALPGSLPEASPPLVPASLETTPLCFVFFRWCSEIRSSSYPPEQVVVATDVLASGRRGKLSTKVRRVFSRQQSQSGDGTHNCQSKREDSGSTVVTTESQAEIRCCVSCGPH
jgi:hypothetical protein